MDISIIIPTLLSAEQVTLHLNELLESIPISIEAEILIIHNGQPIYETRLRRTRDESMPREKNVSIQHFFLEERNVNKARNFGVLNCKSQNILFLDDDVLPCDPSIFLRVANTSLEQGIEGGLYQLTEPMAMIDVAYVLIANQWIYSGQLLEKNFHLVGGFMWGHVDHFKWDGGFDESIEFGGSETEFLLRFARQNIHPIKLIEQQHAFHKSRIKIQQLLRKAQKQARTHRIYFSALQLPLLDLSRLFDWSNISALKKIAIKFYIAVYRHAFQKEFLL